MNKFLKIVSFIFLSNAFIIPIAFALENANDTTNAVVAHHSQRKTLIDKTIISEKHRHKQAQQKLIIKRSKKKMSKVSHAEVTPIV